MHSQLQENIQLRLCSPYNFNINICLHMILLGILIHYIVHIYVVMDIRIHYTVYASFYNAFKTNFLLLIYN